MIILGLVGLFTINYFNPGVSGGREAKTIDTDCKIKVLCYARNTAEKIGLPKSGR